MGIDLCACHKKNPLNPMEIIAIIIHIAFKEVVCDNLKPKGQPISKIPAKNRYNQFIFYKNYSLQQLSSLQIHCPKNFPNSAFASFQCSLLMQYFTFGGIISP